MYVYTCLLLHKMHFYCFLLTFAKNNSSNVFEYFTQKKNTKAYRTTHTFTLTLDKYLV